MSVNVARYPTLAILVNTGQKLLGQIRAGQDWSGLARTGQVKSKGNRNFLPKFLF